MPRREKKRPSVTPGISSGIATAPGSASLEDLRRASGTGRGRARPGRGRDAAPRARRRRRSARAARGPGRPASKPGRSRPSSVDHDLARDHVELLGGLDDRGADGVVEDRRRAGAPRSPIRSSTRSVSAGRRSCAQRRSAWARGQALGHRRRPSRGRPASRGPAGRCRSSCASIRREPRHRAAAHRHRAVAARAADRRPERADLLLGDLDRIEAAARLVQS